jgi:hypothetical protein
MKHAQLQCNKIKACGKQQKRDPFQERCEHMGGSGQKSCVKLTSEREHVLQGAYFSLALKLK